MDRTRRATLLAAVIAFVIIAGTGVFVGFEPSVAVTAGIVAAALGGGLIWGAARRAESFHPDPPPDGTDV